MARNPLDRLGQDAAKVERFLQGAPRVMGHLAVRQYVAMFRRQAWVDEQGNSQPWRARKVQRYRRKSGKKSSRLLLTAAGKADRGRALLVQSGRLRRSIRVTGRDKDSVTIGSDVPYARAQNEGDAGHHNLPARQFMGASSLLTADVRAFLDQGIKDILG